MATYAHMTVEQLRAKCRRLKIKGCSNKNRRGLIAMLNLHGSKKKRKAPARKRKASTRKAAPRRRSKPKKRQSSKQKSAAKKMFAGLTRKINARRGAWVKRKKALYKKALLALDRKKKIKISPKIKTALKASVKRSKYA